MESKNNSTKLQEPANTKKDWRKPEIVSLKMSKTKGGYIPDFSEDEDGDIYFS